MQGFFIDVQGTLIDDDKFLPLPGSIEFLDYLNKNRIPFVLITNNTKRPSEEFKNYLKNLGFDFKFYLDPLMVVKEIIKDKTVAAYGQEKFVEIIKNISCTDYENPQLVLLGIKLYDNETLSDITEKLLKGSELIGMHRTSLYVHKTKRYPGLGAVLEMLKYATGKDYVTVGKPSREFFDRAKSYLGINYDKITIISDDLKGDLTPAEEMGMKTVLVLSGKIKNSNEIVKKPDHIYKNLGDLLNKWRKNGR